MSRISAVTLATFHLFNQLRNYNVTAEQCCSNIRLEGAFKHFGNLLHSILRNALVFTVTYNVLNAECQDKQPVNRTFTY